MNLDSNEAAFRLEARPARLKKSIQDPGKMQAEKPFYSGFSDNGGCSVRFKPVLSGN